MIEDTHNSVLLSATTAIVSSYLSKNDANVSEIPDLIGSVYRCLAGAMNSQVGSDESSQTTQTGSVSSGSEAADPVPAVDPMKSVFPDYIVCLEDGKQFSMMKRHLLAKYGMTPDEYRRKWRLPATYPMTAPNYAKARSVIAKSSGLGLHKQAVKQAHLAKHSRNGKARRPGQRV